MDIAFMASAADFHDWLAENHATASELWVGFYNKASGKPSITYQEAVDEALCFGWIDSKTVKRDAQSRYQYYCPRKPKSIWSKINKAKIERLIAEGKMTAAGMRVVDLAKENGSWSSIDDIEEGLMPDDLQAAMEAEPAALANFQAFSHSARKLLNYWVASAKRPETRAQRIAIVVSEAAAGRRANQVQPKKE